MFLRFTKGKYDADNKRMFRKCVFMGGTLVMEYGDKVVGIAQLSKESDKAIYYNVLVARECELGARVIERYIKDMIGKSNKFNENPSTKMRKYIVERYNGDCLPLTAKIYFELDFR